MPAPCVMLIVACNLCMMYMSHKAASLHTVRECVPYGSYFNRHACPHAVPAGIVTRCLVRVVWMPQCMTWAYHCWAG